MHNQVVDVVIALHRAVTKENEMNAEYLTMTFEQLMERQRFIAKKYNVAISAGTNPEVINQMLAHMEAIRHAMWELGYKQQFDSTNKEDPFGDSIVN